MEKIKKFFWEGVDSKGVLKQGEIEAESLKLAKLNLQSKDITVNKISPVKNSNKGKKIKRSDIANFTRQFATLSESGVPVLRSLDIIIESSENPKFKNLISKIRDEVNEGAPLSKAFSNNPNYFDMMYTGLIAAGEDSGSLDIMMNRLADHMEKTEAIKKKVKKALTYPISILVIAFVIVVILLLKVVPVFQGMFEDFGAELPAFTQMVVDASEFMKSYWLFVFGGIGATIFITKSIHKKSEAFRDKVDRLTLKLPILGSIIKESLISRFARVLSTTFASGIPIIDGLESVEKSINNVVYRDAVNQIRDQVKLGNSIANAVRGTNAFPPTLYNMIDIGEESGSLDHMLNKSADIFESNVNDKVDNLTALLEPLIMVILAVILGGVIIALYLPVFQMGSVAS